VTRALLRKELREHGVVLGALYLLQALVFLGQRWRGDDGGGAFVPLRPFVLSMGALGALVVSNRLVVREYAGRTQLFLETLPVARWRVALVKFSLGAAAALLPVALAFVSCALSARGTEPVTARYLAIVGARTGVAMLVVFAFAFMAGMLGRYRLGLWLMLLLTAFTLEEKAKLPLRQVALLRLLGEDLPFERHVFPVEALWAAGAFGLGCLAVAAALALAREGAVATFLAQRMTSREKVFFVGLSFAYVGMWAVIDAREVRPTFDLVDGRRAQVGRSTVGVAPSQAWRAAPAQQAADRAAQLLESFREWLGIDASVRLFLLPSQELDPDVFLRAGLPKTDGVVIQAALADPALDVQAMDAFILGEYLNWYSRERAAREPMAWFAQGLVRWWVDRRTPGFLQLDHARAAFALPHGLTARDIRQWATTQERLGECVSAAVAERLTETLVDRLGEARLRLGAQKALAQRPPDDVRGTWTNPDPERVLGEAGLTLDELAAAAGGALDADRAAQSAALAGVPHWDAGFEVAPLEGGNVFELRHHLAATPPAEGVAYSVRYQLLGPWTTWVPRSAMARYDSTDHGVLPLTVDRGSRGLLCIERFEPALQCTVRLLAQRWEAR